MSGAQLGRMVARSLTDHDVFAFGEAGAEIDNPDEIAAALTAAGWGREKVAAARRDALAADRPWPFMVSAAERGGVGAAQLLAASRLVAEHLGVGAEVRLRDASMPLSPHDRALLNERPPHHGNVG